MTTSTAESRFRGFTDEQIAAELARIERGLDRLDGACWPAAGVQRADLLAALDDLRKEIQRRAT